MQIETAYHTPQLVCDPASGRGRYKGPITPSPAQCRANRTRLAWCSARLADAAGITEKTVRDFESGARTPHARTLIAIRRTFREAGLLQNLPGDLS
jgi:DNA-binding XRE family transcriptional regulator